MMRTILVLATAAALVGTVAFDIGQNLAGGVLCGFVFGSLAMTTLLNWRYLD